MKLFDNHENKTQRIHLLSLVLFLQTLMLFSRLAHETCVVEGEGIALHPTVGSGRCRPPHLQGRLRPETSSVWPSVSLTRRTLNSSRGLDLAGMYLRTVFKKDMWEHLG